MISHDVIFDESAFGLSMLMSNEDVDDLDLLSFDMDDEDPRSRYFQQTGKCKAQPSNDDEGTSMPRAVRRRPGLEESSAPDYRSSRRPNGDEKETSEDQHDTPIPPAFWHASANDAEATTATTDFSEHRHLKK